jgi:hypothetical protein
MLVDIPIRLVSALRVGAAALLLATATVRGAAPAHDHFLNAQSLPGVATGSVAGSNVNATAQLDEPSVLSGGHSVWYRWISPFSGTATVQLASSDYPALLAVFSEIPTLNHRPDDLVFVAVTNGTGSITWVTDAGNQYWFALDGEGGATGQFTMNWQFTPDGRRADLVPFISSPSVADVGQISECEAGHGCGTTNTQRVLRFGTLTRNIGEANLYLVPLTNLQYEYHPCHFHTHLKGYADYRLLSNGVPVVLGAKASFCLQDGVRFDTNAFPRQRFGCGSQGISRGWGDYYWPGLPCQWIDITGVAPGRYTLQVEIDPDGQLPESNDSNNVASIEVFVPAASGTHVNEILETALPQLNARFEIEGDNRAATRDAGEPIVGAGHTVWYRWVAPSNGLMSIDVLRRNFLDARVGVFTGSSVSNLAAVNNLDPFPASAPGQRVIFQAVSNMAYYVIVDSAQTNVTGRFQMNGWMGGLPNDDFENATGWDDAFHNLLLNTANATKQPGEPNHAGEPGGRSVWFPFIPSITRAVTISTSGSDFDTVLAVYAGTSLLDLEELASNDNVDGVQRWSQVVLDAEEGEQYWIAVDGVNGAGGRMDLSIYEVDPPTQFLHVSVHHGEIELRLLGERDRNYQIQSSTNLIQWTPVETIYKDGATAHIHLPYDTNYPVRFFRAQKMPEND